MTASRSPRLVVHVSIPNVPAVLAEEAEQADDAGPVCGWYESSWALRQGLAVQEVGLSELPDSDGTLAALWLAALAVAPAAAASARWQ